MRNPLNRLIAGLGLVMLGAIAYLVVTGALTVPEAGVRAGITLGAVIVLRKLGRAGIGMLAGSMERMAVETPRRRTEDGRDTPS